MPIRYYLSILVASCLIGGYLIEFFNDGRHSNYQELADTQNQRLLLEKDFKYFQQNISQLLISTDLILASGETYLIDGAQSQLTSLLQRSQEFVRAEMLGDSVGASEGLLQSLQEIGNQLMRAARANDDTRSDTLNEILGEYDRTSIQLVSFIDVLSMRIKTHVDQGKVDLKTAKQSLRRATILSIVLFSLIIFALWVWSDRKITKPLTALAKIAEEAESGSNFAVVKNAPAEILQLSARLAVATNSLIEQAQLDPLTGLLNRREFERRLTELLNSKANDPSESPGVICYIDLDHFKIVNDTCGHAAGDEILIRVAGALSDTLRNADIVSRLGGDEFGMVFVGCPLARATDIAHRLREMVGKIDYKWNGEVFRISASIGLSEIPAGNRDLKAIVNTVDAACSAAKNGGRNRVQILDSADASVAKTRNEMILVNQIYNAIEQSNFVLYYQPIVRLGEFASSHRHIEVLVRMLDSAGNVVLPGLFLPTVDRYQLSSGVDKWVVEATLDYVLAQGESDSALELVNVNLSAHSIGDSEFCEFVAERFERNPWLGKKICFEVTETAATTNTKNAIRFVEEMREFGAKFALDDFGSGHSSFGYLKSISFDFIKIDGAFIQGMLQSSIDMETVVSVVNLARTSGATVIAEYVDRPDIEQKLIELGVVYGQGFYYGHPAPLDGTIAPQEIIAASG